MTPLFFTKAQTNGNDFIIFEGSILENDKIKQVSDRKFGVGADQIIFLKKINQNAYEVKFFNQDGSSANMCGNGLCAVVRYLNKSCEFLVSKQKYSGYIDEKGLCCIETPLPKELDKQNFNHLENYFSDYKFIDSNNKHIVALQKSKDELPEEIAKNIQKNFKEFNVHFVFINKNDIFIKSFERGVGHTLACGSGAIASVFAFNNTPGLKTVFHDIGKSYVEIQNSKIIFKTDPKISFVGTIF